MASVAEEESVEAQFDRQREVDDEGYIFDVITGEVLGITNEDFTSEDTNEAFQIRSRKEVEWVLGKMFEEEARLRDIEARLVALASRLEAQKVEPRNRLAFLERRFRPEIIAQARRDLEAQGGRSKTAKYDHGQVSFRNTAGKNEITDPAGVVEWARAWAPEAIAVKESITIAGLQIAIEEAREATGEEPDTSAFFRSTGPGESVTIKAGLDR